MNRCALIAVALALANTASSQQMMTMHNNQDRHHHQPTFNTMQFGFFPFAPTPGLAPGAGLLNGLVNPANNNGFINNNNGFVNNNNGGFVNNNVNGGLVNNNGFVNNGVNPNGVVPNNNVNINPVNNGLVTNNAISTANSNLPLVNNNANTGLVNPATVNPNTGLINNNGSITNNGLVNGNGNGSTVVNSGFVDSLRNVVDNVSNALAENASNGNTIPLPSNLPNGGLNGAGTNFINNNNNNNNNLVNNNNVNRELSSTDIRDIQNELNNLINRLSGRGSNSNNNNNNNINNNNNNNNNPISTPISVVELPILNNSAGNSSAGVVNSALNGAQPAIATTRSNLNNNNNFVIANGVIDNDGRVTTRLTNDNVSGTPIVNHNNQPTLIRPAQPSQPALSELSNSVSNALNLNGNAPAF